MAAAIDDGGKLDTRVAATNVKRTDSLRAIDLVPGDRQQVDIVLLDVYWDFANSLHTIDGKDNAVLLGNLADFRHRIDDANLIVGIHDGDQYRLRRNRFAHVFRIDAAIALHRQI